MFQDFDLNEQFGAVQVGPKVDGVIEIQARMNGPASIYEFALRVSRLYVFVRSFCSVCFSFLFNTLTSQLAFLLYVYFFPFLAPDGL